MTTQAELREKIAEIVTPGLNEKFELPDDVVDEIKLRALAKADRILALLPPAPAVVEATAEDAAQLIEQKIADYTAEHGMYDPSTGHTEYPGEGEQWTHEMHELAEEIRCLTRGGEDAKL